MAKLTFWLVVFIATALLAFTVHGGAVWVNGKCYRVRLGGETPPSNHCRVD